jgi:hypothetical protein
VVVHSHGQDLLSPFLTDDVFAEAVVNYFGRRDLLKWRAALNGIRFLFDDLASEVDAFVANINSARPRD